MDCITCGSKEVDARREHYFVVPGHVMVPNSYLLCEEHKNVRYYFDDIYTPDAKRKEIDHEAIVKRSQESPPNDEECVNAIQMTKTSPDFRKGFIFAVTCILDVASNREDYTLEKLNDLLGSIIDLNKAGVYWGDINHVIERND